MNDKATENEAGRRQRDERPGAVFGVLWRSPLVKLALVVALAGAGLWVYGAATRAERPAVVTAGGGGGSGLAVGLQGVAAGGVTGGGAAAAGPRLAESAGPKLAGGGVSFVGGYGLGWLFRRFLKLAAILTGLGVAGVAGLSMTGVLSDDDTAKVRAQLARGGGWVREHGGELRERATAVLPSSAAALGGLAFGFRRR